MSTAAVENSVQSNGFPLIVTLIGFSKYARCSRSNLPLPLSSDFPWPGRDLNSDLQSQNDILCIMPRCLSVQSVVTEVFAQNLKQ